MGGVDNTEDNEKWPKNGSLLIYWNQNNNLRFLWFERCVPDPSIHCIAIHSLDEIITRAYRNHVGPPRVAVGTFRHSRLKSIHYLIIVFFFMLLFVRRVTWKSDRDIDHRSTKNTILRNVLTSTIEETKHVYNIIYYNMSAHQSVISFYYIIICAVYFARGLHKHSVYTLYGSSFLFMQIQLFVCQHAPLTQWIMWVCAYIIKDSVRILTTVYI